MVLLIETERTGYDVSQVLRTMTVGEIIEALSGYDEDTPVYLSNDRGYTYGGIHYESIREMKDEESEEYLERRMNDHRYWSDINA